MPESELTILQRKVIGMLLAQAEAVDAHNHPATGIHLCPPLAMHPKTEFDSLHNPAQSQPDPGPQIEQNKGPRAALRLVHLPAPKCTAPLK